MLIRLTNTNSAPAEAAILPGVAAHLRVQVAREQARLLEHGCSIEKASGTAGASVSIRGRRLPPTGSGRELATAPFEREKLAIRSLVAAGLTSVVSI